MKMREHRTFKKGLLLTVVFAMMMVLSASSVYARPGDEKLEKKAASIAAKTNTTPVRTIQWEAKLTKKVKVDTIGTKDLPVKTVKIKKGSTITVVQRDYHVEHGISLCELPDSRRCWIKNKYLLFEKPVTSASEGDYDKATKEAFVNGMNIRGLKGDRMIWISLGKQRLNIFEGKKGEWKLIRVFPCSTGKVDSPTLDQTFKSYFKIQKKAPSVQYGDSANLHYYCFVYGYGIHQWPGGPMKKYMGKMPVSNSCIRLKKKDAKWVYDDENIPVGTRVYVW